MNRSIRVLIAKVGLDGHEMGSRLIARCLRDAGMEVVYTGLRQTPEMVVSAALQEDIDVVGLSFLTGVHNENTTKVIHLMKERGMDPDKIVIVVGGIIPLKDINYLKSLGVDGVFGPGSDTREITKLILDAVKRKKGIQ